jgi:hypothetical protein
MGIYPVKLAQWYKKPKKDDPDYEENKFRYDAARFIVRMNACATCKRKIRYRDSISMHSLPWGHYSEVWCSWKCCNNS